jgi:hypothetical protein
MVAVWVAPPTWATGTSPNASGLGATAIDGSVPVPVRLTTALLMSASVAVVKVRVADRGPAAAAWNVTDTVSLPPAASARFAQPPAQVTGNSAGALLTTE